MFLVIECSGPRVGVEFISWGTDVGLTWGDGVREIGVWIKESGRVEGPGGRGKGIGGEIN